MSLKKNPLSLYLMSIGSVSKMLLQQWREAYFTDHLKYSEEMKTTIGPTIPYTIYGQIFERMVDSHARLIQREKLNDKIPSIVYLIDSLINPCLHKLNLSCLRHMGAVPDDEIRYLECMLINGLPNLYNLVEISLQTSGTDFTLPTCNDVILEKIGDSCHKLKTLDISYNHTVTDKGLDHLIPSDVRFGCPLLSKISLFECSVTSEGVAKLIGGLLHLKFLGYRETGQSLLFMFQNDFKKPIGLANKKLDIVHINNLGTISRTIKDFKALKCDERMVHVISTYCPNATGLKLRVDDTDVRHFHKISSASIVELVYNTGVPTSPGSHTIQYMQLSGSQFISLCFVCDKFSTQFLKAVCEQCHNLKRLWIRCNMFCCDRDITKTDRSQCSLTSLKVFFFRIGSPRHELCVVPHSVISYVVHKATSLKELTLSMKNTLFCDSYVEELFSSIQTSQLKNLMILIPDKNLTNSSLSLSMTAVETLISLCPKLKELGNLLVWNVSLEETHERRRQLKLANSALVLIYRFMYS